MNKDLADTCLRYLDGDLAADELQAFGQLLVQSPEAADLLSQLAMDEQHYRATPAEEQENLLPELLKLEASAQPLSHDAMTFDDAGKFAEQPDHSYRNTLKILGDSGFWGYVVGHALRSKPAKRAGAAAVVLLVATLVLVFTDGPSNTPQAPGIATTPSEPDLSEPASATATRSVATLTAQRDAQWSPSAERALARGSELHAGTQLHPGDRLTLTAGTAEITTTRGAIAILEAPATIELLDSPNALRLHSGKLVGICETDSSKGFLVRTPHMDIIDLGTRFGVDASTLLNATEVHVYLGEVEVSLPDAAPSQHPQPLRLGQDQAARTDATDVKITAIQPVFDKFSTGLGLHRLPGTGVGLEPLQRDASWQIVAIDGQVLTEKIRLDVSGDTHSTDFAGDPALGRWIGYREPREAGPGQDRILYTVQNQLVVPDTVDLDRASLRVLGHIDDALEALRFNGKPVSGLNRPKQYADPWYFSESLRNLGLRRGTNIVEFDIANEPQTRLGLVIQWHLDGKANEEEHAE